MRLMQRLWRKMSKRKKQQPSVDELKSLREQLQDYIYDIVNDFEQQTGMTVVAIDVLHVRKPGFGEEERLIIKAHTEI